MVLTRTRKLAYTVALFAVAIGLVLMAGDVKGVGPLFGVWIPLPAVSWLLTRPEPGDPPRVAAEATSETDEPGPQGNEEPTSAG